jgi:hypothetical protein
MAVEEAGGWGRTLHNVDFTKHYSGDKIRQVEYMARDR